MEVDSWVSVQARREQFEQLYEDSPLTSPSKNTPFQPAPRPRVLSSPHKNSQNCVELSVSRGKTTQVNDREGKGRLSKHTPERCDLSNSERLSQNNIQGKEHVKSTGQSDEELLDSSVAAKSSSANRIPVFKPANTAADGKNVEVERTVTPISSQGKRGRLFSHIRSMSHGNFVIKRDSSVGRDAPVDEQNGPKVQRENKCHRDWLTPKCKYRSDVLGIEDSKSSSSFEGKQRIVSNVVKNMKNKEAPTVLRKLSFSSKNEKDFKNIKQKFVIPDSRRKKPGSLPSLSDGTASTNLFNKQKSKSRDSVIDVSHKTVTKEKSMKAKSHTSDIAIVPVLIAKAVAHVASKRCAAQSRDTASSPSSLSSEDRLSNPPARPPRRRAAGPDPVPRKKGKAPTPPSQCSTAVTEENKKNHSDNSFMSSSPDESPSIILYRYRDSPDDPKSSAIVSSCHYAKISSENAPDVVHTSSTGSTQLSKFFENNSLAVDSEQRQEHDNAERETFEMHTDFENTGNADHREETECSKNETLDEKNTTEVEGLPAGPPPKKPPRTFAYDIYKNVSLPTLKPEDEESGEEGKAAGKTTQPIYAVPFKKNSKMIPKPPVRSKSDLSKEIMKPSVAPKPPHVLARAKRTSLVDPLSNLEKDEDAAIASEFQRQAHVRYSLRRPSKSRSSPSPRNVEEGNSHSHSSSRLLNDSLGSQHDLDYSTIDYGNDKRSGHLISESVTQDGDKISKIHRSPGLAKVKSPMAKTDWRSEYEDITPLASSVAAVSCHALTGVSSSALDEQPLSLTYCFANTPSPDVTYPSTKRSMSDETLYKGCRQDEPVYATPTFKTNNHRGDQASQKELHYMCSILFTDEEEAAGGRDKGEPRHRSSRDASTTEAEGGNKGKSSLILAWKREFRQSCRQVQSRIKKTVVR